MTAGGERGFASTGPTLWSPDPRARETVSSYSQNAEDVRLWRVFSTVEDGFYVDVGAADPSVGSVTRLFYDHGWSGINVEPNPSFEILREARPRDVNVRAAVGEIDGSVSFFLTYPDLGMSTLDPSSHKHVPDAIERTEEIVVPACRLETILRNHATGRTIHFLKVDAEGAEREVLASSDWQTFRPIVVVVEAIEAWSVTPTHERWEFILTDAGYEFAAFDGINRFYVERAHRDLIPALAYPVSALDRFVPASSQDQLEVERDGRRDTSLEAALRDLRDERTESRNLRASLVRANELLAEANRETAGLASEVERLRGYEGALETVFRSRTWRAGRMIASALAPARGVFRLAGLRRVRAERPLGPAKAYAAAVGRGSPWHFARRRSRGGARLRNTPLDTLAARWGKPQVAVDASRAAHIVAELDDVGWADDESLRCGRLTWAERHAVAEADAIVQLVLGFPDEPPRRGRRSGVSWPRPVVVVDARCLQDPLFRTRGVGLHARRVLTATRAVTTGRTLALLTSAELPDLDDDVAVLADHVLTTTFDVREARVDLFVQLSPMTASAAPAVPFLGSQACRTASVVYDFIPSTFPDAYLRSATDILTNRARIETLRHYDLLLPISASTATVCRRILGSRVRTAVTGVADPLESVAPVPLSMKRPFVLVPGGGDPRKNVAAAVAALAQHRAAGGDSLRAVVVGALTDAQAVALHDLARRVGLGNALELRSSVGAGELVSLNEAAELVFVASFAEGFSIPVAEAVLRGTPVVASDIPAHRELVGAGRWLAEPDDVQGLAEAIAEVRGARAAVAERQRRELGDTADPSAVLTRTTAALESVLPERLEKRPAPGSHANRPCLALVSPFPPQRSGVADYTAFTFRQVAKYAEVEVYSAAPSEGRASFSMHALSAAPYLDRRFDSVVNVVGNSHFHLPILDLMESYGGACIAHDNRMFEGYRYDRGDPWLAALVSTRTQTIRPHEIEDLLLDLDRLPSIGYDVIARQASPLIVHGRTLADRIERETGVTPVVVPFVPYNLPKLATIDEAVREDARRALGLPRDVLHVATFGIVDRRTKGTDLIVGAGAWLRTWDVPMHVHILGSALPEEHQALATLAEELEIGAEVTLHGHVSRETLDQFLLGVDMAVQLRTSAVLSLSGALADCIAFGVPTVTTEDLAGELEAPSYVVTTGSATSSLLVAESIESLRHRRPDEGAAFEAERRDYLSRRSVDAYARKLLDALGLGSA